MPGHIGTSIVFNSLAAHGRNPKELTVEQLAELRTALAKRGISVDGASDEDLQAGLVMQAEAFRDTAPLTAAQAATIILEAVRAGEWRILVGEDARVFDAAVREDPVSAYEPSFVDELIKRGGGISVVR